MEIESSCFHFPTYFLFLFSTILILSNIQRKFIYFTLILSAL